MSVYKVLGSRVGSKTPDNARHQVSDDDQVTDSDTKTFDGNGSIEYHGGVWVSDLTESEEAG